MVEASLLLLLGAGLILGAAPRKPWRYRVGTIFLVVALLLMLRGLVPGEAARQSLQADITLTLGYGHVIGAFVFARQKIMARMPAGIPPWLCVVTLLSGLAAAFSLYPLVLPREPAGSHALAFFLATQSLNYWHTAENDGLLARSYRQSLQLGPFPRQLREHAASLLLTGGMLSVGAALALRLVALPFQIGFADFFSAAVLYHVFGFLIFFADRARASRSPALAARVVAIHLPPLFLTTILATQTAPWLEALRAVYLDVGLFLFLNGIHVVQTLFTRGLAPRPQPRARALWSRTTA